MGHLVEYSTKREIRFFCGKIVAIPQIRRYAAVPVGPGRNLNAAYSDCPGCRAAYGLPALA